MSEQGGWKPRPVKLRLEPEAMQDIIDNQVLAMTPEGTAAAKQELRRRGLLNEAIASTLADRVVDAYGPDIMRIGVRELQEMIQDPMFQVTAKYWPTLNQYSNGKLREKPIRPLLQNEVGMLFKKDGSSKIVVMDENPDGSKISAQSGYGSKVDFPAPTPQISLTSSMPVVATPKKPAGARGFVLNIGGGKKQ